VRTIELDPPSAGRVVALLHGQMLSPPEIAAALPRVPTVLAALVAPYFEDGMGKEYLDLTENAALGAGPDLLEAWGAACLRAGEPARLRDRMDRIGRLEDTAMEARRLRLRSSARLALGDRDGACEDAGAARGLLPDDPGIAAHLGQVSLQAGRAGEAARAFKDALALVSRGSGDRGWRAALYAEIGAAEEALGRPDLAYDAYRNAVELDRSQELPRRRLAEMKKAAGIEE
jgi:tetratricopeptide (TPR) repeat protein